ncbi:hypothetical protein SDC9_209544 [bioreactor metagenome]|uniref:Uncharacterized protein n=1 Tax=bioreactor metagenome TaxID=1076179 RepID=A0A645JFD5_9ZZZZ|nr:hypothetical protein [Bacteroidaceae bacterium]MEA4975998.1 hypothetical protein [Paludibacter sp.]
MTLQELYNNASRDFLPLAVKINVENQYKCRIDFGSTVTVSIYDALTSHVLLLFDLRIYEGELNCDQIGDRRYSDKTYEQLIQLIHERFL